ncbi:MAG: undecaprenyldiphospho-muramoylpentapeptide beta-N-acetylglucosaminyltransferase [Chromatiales bacterium]|jgi:UDP-N-acetylglucosamine--N-acetylmuramyl-(pentapeptide) pyrophosphoryl-undecaprenol N-acetylglucosamine transferase
MAGRMMVMAGGTGGHVFPALAVATEMQQRGWEVFWLGTRNSFEARVIPQQGIAMEWVSIQGMRGKGLLRKLLMPLQLLRAMFQAASVIRNRKPDVVLGMGGFVSGPGGLVARLLGRPLVIQEQNTVPGMTNQWLAKIAKRVFEAFPGSFAAERGAVVSGNPVRAEICALAEPQQRLAQHTGPVRLLVLGGSLGAQALNELLPAALAKFTAGSERPQVRHQAGRDKAAQTEKSYAQHGVSAEVTEFIEDMAAAYAWADLVVCRSGALTVSELTAAGVASLLVPYPHAVDDHQTKNAAFLVQQQAALLMPQAELTADSLAAQLQQLLQDKPRLLAMAQAARSLAVVDSSRIIADACEEVAL